MQIFSRRDRLSIKDIIPSTIFVERELFQETPCALPERLACGR
ncbi:hypothetical protein PATSB16_40830 [Pandoraea thiooxydans]|nr:hypothetical protein PATSB16_40830 [Pandoraea thiooxydans]